MNIYSSTKALPYVYVCQEKNSPYFYIGYRYSNHLPSTEDFGKHYFTSNSYVKENFDNFDCTIIAEFFTKRDALDFESQLIKESDYKYCINVVKNKQRKKYQSIKIDTDPKICALPGCGKIHQNWRMKCCCASHQRSYSGMRAHQK